MEVLWRSLDLPANSERSTRLCMLGIFILTVHTGAAAMTENSFRVPGFRSPIVYALFENVIMVLCSLLQMRISRNSEQSSAYNTNVRSKSFVVGGVICGFLMAISHGASYVANAALNYTTAVVFKSAKVPTTILGGWFFGLKKGGHRLNIQIAWSSLLTLGLILFAVAERTSVEKPKLDATGLLAVGCNLVMGSVTVNQQQKVLQQQSVSEETHSSQSGSDPKPKHSLDPKLVLVLIQYSVGFFVYLFYTTCVTTELQETVALVSTSQPQLVLYAVIDNILSYLGILAILQISKEFDAGRANVVCSVRKAITIVLSYMIFPKPFSTNHAIGFAFIALASWQLHREGHMEDVACGRDVSTESSVKFRKKKQ